MHKTGIMVAVALWTSVGLVVFSVIMTTSAIIAGRWVSDVLAFVALFAAIVVAGFAIRRARRKR